MSGIPMTEAAMRQTIARASNIVVQLARGSDGRRRLVSITEVTGMEGPTVTLQELFRFEQTGVDAKGNVVGAFSVTGIRPKCLERIERSGVDPERLLASFTGG